MPQYEEMEVLILVKAAPVMTSELEETMCVAGIRVDGGRNDWVRLHPVPFRDLADDARFAKYQLVRLRCARHRTDRRPETWTPIQGSIVLGETVSPRKGWERRRPYVAELGEVTMCQMIEWNRQGSGPAVPSLAVVRPRQRPNLVITAREPDQLRTWQERADAADATMSLFEDPAMRKAPFEVVPWRFRYHYRCAASSCNGHQQTIVDWEAAALWRRLRSRREWEAEMRQKFEQDMWTDKDSVLFVGNMEQRPWNFLVLGVFWPPDGPAQGTLL